MIYIGLVPYSKESLPGDNVDWHFILFGKYINTHKKFNPRWEFYISDCDGIGNEIFLKFLWGNKKHNDEIEPWYKIIALPWHLECFAQACLIQGKFTRCKYDECKEYEEDFIQSKYSCKDRESFVFQDKDRLNIATCYAHRCYDSIYWFPDWLKEKLYRKRDIMWIEFKNDVGVEKFGRGITALPVQFKNSLYNSWCNFRDKGLKELL